MLSDYRTSRKIATVIKFTWLLRKYRIVKTTKNRQKPNCTAVALKTRTFWINYSKKIKATESWNSNKAFNVSVLFSSRKQKRTDESWMCDKNILIVVFFVFLCTTNSRAIFSSTFHWIALDENHHYNTYSKWFGVCFMLDRSFLLIHARNRL